MTTEQSETKSCLPELQTVETATSIPVVNLIWTKSHDGYEMVKNSNRLFKWYLSTTEATANTLACFALPVVERPLKFVDGLTAKGLDLLVTKVPAVKTRPEEIVANTTKFVGEKAAAVGSFTLNTSNAVLNNRVGNFFLGTVDKMAKTADETVNKYLPKPVDESEIHLLPDENNHLAQTLNSITEVFASTGKRIMRKKRSTAYTESFKKSAATTTTTLRKNIEKIRSKTKEEKDVENVRSLSREVAKLVNVADTVADGLTEAQKEDLKLLRWNVETMCNILEQTPTVKDLSDEDVDDLNKKIEYTNEKLVDIFKTASADWYKIPEEKIVAAKQEFDKKSD